MGEAVKEIGGVSLNWTTDEFYSLKPETVKQLQISLVTLTLSAVYNCKTFKSFWSWTMEIVFNHCIISFDIRQTSFV
ncbi:hypothetical protein R3W88_026860 [Solanum pinnatisectum]|uniref:Uncharacterized protein n=1 Tax=Solanum pinnatisectum TaxID=50273 RepID=A0AAV9LEN5_9SOLN|nr:hypothetical protein R3W88_026860 [Solanum pinnatisectum]